MTDTNFKKGEDRDEKIDIFLDTVTWYFSTKPMADWTAGAIRKVNNNIKKLNENIEKANESSTKLSKALNRLTLLGVIIASVGVLVAIIKLSVDYSVIKF